MKKYSITIEEVNEIDETVIHYVNPANAETGRSTYDFTEQVRPSLVKEKVSTGKKEFQVIKIYEQTVDTLDMNSVIKAINNI